VEVFLEGLLLYVNGSAFGISQRIAGRAVGDSGSYHHFFSLGKLFNKALGNKCVASVGAMGAVVFHGTAANYKGDIVFLYVFYFPRETIIEKHIFSP
jgi:hypothetical protein